MVLAGREGVAAPLVDPGWVGAVPAAAAGIKPAAGAAVLAGAAGPAAALAGTGWAGADFAGAALAGAAMAGAAAAGAVLIGTPDAPGEGRAEGVVWANWAAAGSGGKGLSLSPGVSCDPLPAEADRDESAVEALTGPWGTSTSPASAAIRQEASGSMGILRGRSPGMNKGGLSGRAASSADLTDKPWVPDRPLRPV
jgi:hypothetical protein